MNTAAASFISSHAITRYQERVAPVSRREALRAIREILSQARTRSRPRHWTTVNARPGCRYLYSSEHPGICLVLRGAAVVTLFSRAACAAWTPAPDGGAAARVPQPYRRPCAGDHRTWEAA